MGYIGLKTIPSLASSLGGATGGSGGYMGSGTDLSSIPAGFFTETPPVFNITNTPPDSFFSTPSLSDGETKKDVSVATLGGTDITPNNVNWSSTGASWITDNPISNFINSMKPTNWGQDLSENQYTKMSNDYSSLSIFKNENVKNGAKSLGGFLANSLIPFPISLLLNATPASACPSGKCPTVYNSDYNYSNPKLDIPSFQSSFTVYTPKKAITSYNPNEFINAQYFLGELRKNVAPTIVTYSKKAYNDIHEETRTINKILANNVAEQNKFATNLAKNNCSPAIAINSCTGTKKSVNYATTVSSGTRYYENTGTSLTRSDLTVSH